MVQPQFILTVVRKAAVQDLVTRVRNGRTAPRWAERIWIDPGACELAVGGFGRSVSGSVLEGDWDLDKQPIDEIPKMRAARLHWESGVPWDETGIYDHLLERIATAGEHDGCRDRADVVARFERVDRVFDQVRRERRLRTRSELPVTSVRELGGVYMHIDRDGRAVFGLGGVHRLAMAQVLSFRQMPAQLGVVHPDALSSWTTMRHRPVREYRQAIRGN